MKGKLTTIKNFIAKAARDEETAPEEVATRLQATEDIYVRFQNALQQLLTSSAEPDPRDESEDSEFDKRYYTIRAALLQLLEKNLSRGHRDRRTAAQADRMATRAVRRSDDEVDFGAASTINAEIGGSH